LDILSQLVSSMAQAAPAELPQVISSIVDQLVSTLPAEQLPTALASFLDNLPEIPKEMLAQIVAALLSKIPALPPEIQATVRLAIEGIAGAAVSGAKPFADISAGVSKDTLDKSGEHAAAESASVPAPAMQVEVKAEGVEAPRDLKEIPDNILKLISETVSRIQIGDTQTTITLQKTPDLPGDTTLEVRMENGRIEVVINATDPQTVQLLQNNMAALQSALAAGAGASQVSVSIEGPDTATESEGESEGVGEGSETSETPGEKKVGANRESGGAS
jgi:hypothetical protein